jgi:hypothetical protein
MATWVKFRKIWPSRDTDPRVSEREYFRGFISARSPRACSWRRSPIRPGRVPAAGERPAERGLPDAARHRTVAGRQSGDHGRLSRRRSRISSTISARADDVRQLARFHAVTLEFALTAVSTAPRWTCRAPSRGPRLLPQGMPTPPVFTKVNPADQPILIRSHVHDAAAVDA